MRGFVLVVAAVFLMACGSGSPSDPTATSASSAATVGTNGDGFVPIEIPLTPGMVVELDGTIANNARLDAICATIAMDASLTQYRPGGTGCPQVPNVAATAEASSE